MKLRRTTALLQGVYYALTGIWPILHIGSFMAITGPKTDIWLVKTVGLVLAAIGIGLLAAYGKKSIDVGILTVAILSAIALTAVDIYYVLNGLIGIIYLMDAVAEIILLFLWLISFAVRRKD